MQCARAPFTFATGTLMYTFSPCVSQIESFHLLLVMPTTSSPPTCCTGRVNLRQPSHPRQVNGSPRAWAATSSLSVKIGSPKGALHRSYASALAFRSQQKVRDQFDLFGS